jgi:chemotaxis signal transduction protein
LVGLIVDEVHEVVDVDHQQIARVRDILPEGLGELPSVQGLVHTSEGAMMLLDLAHLFAMGPLSSLPEGWDEGDGFEPDDGPVDVSQVPVTDKVAG